MVPWVPTGMNAGVSTTPWGVENQPRRALPDSWEVRKEKSDMIRDSMRATVCAPALKGQLP